MTIHYLKTWPDYFKDICSGVKTFEFRKNDRDYQVGDTLILQEYDPDTDEYSGREADRLVTVVYDGLPFGLESGYCLMGIIQVSSVSYYETIPT